jgi:HD-like signal output (HDOD) protein
MRPETVPARAEAERLLRVAAQRNPGPWVDHSRYVAQAAAAIARAHPALDEEMAYIVGLLHDVGRQEGVTDMRHVIDGYAFLRDLGYGTPARICLTHSFPIPIAESAAGKWDCTPEELELVRNFLAEWQMDEYDRLIQLCDALAMPSGTVLIEQRLVDVVLRHGFNDYTLPRWRAYLALRDKFSEAVGQSIYSLLPGGRGENN